MPILLLIVIAAIAYWWLMRSRELFCLRFRRGRLSVIRGNPPRALLSELREALGNTGDGVLTARRTPHGAQLSIRGNISESAQQRVRNVFALKPMSKLSARAIDKRQAAHDALTIHWLLRMLGRR